MLKRPTRERIDALHRDPRTAIEQSRAELESIQEKLRVLKDEFEAYATETEGPEKIFFGFDDPARHADWLKRVLDIYAEARDEAGQRIRDLVVYAFESPAEDAMKPHQIARAGRLGSATVYRWRDAGTRNT